MTSEIIQNHDMSQNLETDWIQLSVDRIAGIRKRSNALSLQIYWTGIVGGLNGIVKIIISNDMQSFTTAKTITISTNSNIEDSQILVLYPVFKFLKIVYTKNSITSGDLNASLIYN